MRLITVLFTALLLALPLPVQSASYLEIYDIAKGEAATQAADLRKRVAVACMIKAEQILDEATPSQARLDWALRALENPLAEAVPMLSYALAVNAAAAQAQILNADDAAVQTAVNAAVDALYP